MSNPELFDLATRWAKAERPHLLQMGEEMRHDLAAFAEHALTALKSLEGRITVDEAMKVFTEHTYSCPRKGFDETWSEFDVREKNAFRNALTKSANP